MKKIALLFAGQGAQEVGMGKALASEVPVVAEVFARADEALGRKLSDIAWNGPAEALTNTANCQPALYVHGLACLAALREVAGDFAIDAAAGLSLGEWTAHAAAGTFDFATGLRLVEKRGQYMEAACAATAGAMAALIGGDESAVRALAADSDVDVANLNAPGQIVISGEAAKIEMALSVAREHGIRRATLLRVAGAYHSRLMNSAYQRMGEDLLEAELRVPRFPIVSNVTGAVVGTLPEIRQTLQEQITSTVRWTDCMETLLARGCDLFLELGPGGVLAGLLRRTRQDADVMTVADTASVQAAAEKIRGTSSPNEQFFNQ
ncbi:MAG: ACP S-malonyltransferase [Chthoniobacterales bacterium]